MPDGTRSTIRDLFGGHLQQRATGGDAGVQHTAAIHASAQRGIATAGASLPHAETIQRAFGRHDVSGIKAHTGLEAAASARAMGAEAYATENHVVLGGGTDLHTVAHEAAHVVQQRGGVLLKDGVGRMNDHYEQHADAVADRVVRGESAEALFSDMTHTGGDAAVQLRGSRPDFENASTLAIGAEPKVTGVHFGTRPVARVTGGSGQGNHVVSYSVFEWAIYNAVHNQSFFGAVYGVWELARQMPDLPGFSMGHKTEQTYRSAILQTLLAKCEDINGGRTTVHDINFAQVLGDLIDDYLEIRNGLHLTARPQTSGGNTRDKEGAKGLQVFNPTQPLNGGLLHATDLATVIGLINEVFDFHNPRTQDKKAETASKYVKQTLLTIFQAYPTQILPAWYSQIERAFSKDFITAQPAAHDWDRQTRAEFCEEVTS
jgi:hypothetical protein